MDWADMAELGAAEAAPETQSSAEALRRRIDLYCRNLRGGVPGNLAKAYLRQIADDEDRLATLTSRDCAAAPSALDERLY
jgi:hypothetical protein